MLRVRRLLRLEKAPTRLPVQPATKRAQLFSARKLIRAASVMGPTLVAFTLAGIAHAQERWPSQGHRPSWERSRPSLSIRRLSSLLHSSSYHASRREPSVFRPL